MSAIDRARLSLQALMLDSGTILRTLLLDDGAGSTYPDPGGPTQIAVPICAFSRLTGRERLVAAQMGQRGDYRLAQPATGTVVYETDQFGYQGKVYNVTWAPPLTALNLSRVVLLEESGALFTVVTTGIALLLEDGITALLLEDGVTALLLE